MSHNFQGYDQHEFECDSPHCEETFSGEGTFKEVWDEAKRDGWKAKKDDDDVWCHYCPACAEIEGI